MPAPNQATKPARGEARRDRLIDAAETVFTRDGLRGASMERIAAEAGVARATAYAYFNDKEDAFRQVATRLAHRFEAVVTTALQGPEPTRLRDAILAKHELVFQVTRLSPHAADLLAAKDRLAGPIFAATEARILAALRTELTRLGIADPAIATQILHDAADGVAATAPDVSTLQATLGRLVDALVVGLGRPGGAAPWTPVGASRPQTPSS